MRCASPDNILRRTIANGEGKHYSRSSSFDKPLERHSAIRRLAKSCPIKLRQVIVDPIINKRWFSGSTHRMPWIHRDIESCRSNLVSVYPQNFSITTRLSITDINLGET